MQRQPVKWTDLVSALSSLGFLIVGILALYGAWRTYQLETEPVLFLDCRSVLGQPLTAEMKSLEGVNDILVIDDDAMTAEGDAVNKKFGKRYLMSEAQTRKFMAEPPSKAFREAYKCTLSNYGRSPAFNITLSGTVQLRAVRTSVDFVPISFRYPPDRSNSDMLNVPRDGSTIFYIVNASPLFARVIPDDAASIWRRRKAAATGVNFSPRTLSDNDLAPRAGRR